ncbi:hypothetical protein [Rahnella perminowiae]|uniref:hypothetical protein n=1 Tax=Rahnella perminowiae TaxID=2816244 RepID=UPI00215D155F|nr:hypothetical protein [Rahnella perminowiae]MCR9002094.1 hypothetical protein [Rahnella perminowiae]
MSHGGNVVAERHAKTPNDKGGTPSPATRDHPFKTVAFAFSSLCSFLAVGIKRKLTFKEGGRATLPAFGRRLSRDGVRGDAPK